jgi:RimJ/RimL family protein N-acetyltransferase
MSAANLGAATRQWRAEILHAPQVLSVGTFELRPAVEDDVDLLARWMNDPAVAAFWMLAGPTERTRAHVRAQHATGHATPLVGILSGTPMSYWEVYWADLDPLSSHYPAQPYDGGLHLLLGPASARGRGLGGILLRNVASRMFAAHPPTMRVVAEPDVRNVASVRAFTRAGFRRQADLDLPHKRGALMMRERPAPVGKESLT